MPFIVLVAPFVEVTTFPCKLAHSILLVVSVLTFIHVTRLIVVSLLPLAFAVLEAISELSYVDTTIFPFILALSLRFTLIVGASEAVAVCENI